MAAANGVPVLWQFKASHFNEKARWALDWKGVRHERRSLLPGPHMPVVMWISGQKSVPVLQIDGQTITDSTRIIAELERRFPERPLYPADAAARQRALELEEFFDDEIGVHIRRYLFHMVLPDAGFTADLMSPGFGAVARAVYRATFPLTRVAMRMDMGITDDGAARSLARFEAAFDRLEREIGPTGYLVGDTFSVADLTGAALLSPLTFPPEYPYRPPPLPEVALDFQSRFEKRRGFEWAREMYRRHRGTSAAVNA
ncbi:MAG TPA: glutathione S-transferase [Candidatus Eisenbacteria bacterium]|nr:glutathione S-transferase [Candidatus Eisenbacteria bacterium]